MSERRPTIGQVEHRRPLTSASAPSKRRRLGGVAHADTRYRETATGSWQSCVASDRDEDGPRTNHEPRAGPAIGRVERFTDVTFAIRARRLSNCCDEGRTAELAALVWRALGQQSGPASPATNLATAGVVERPSAAR
jgi:hypothetical protein